VKYPKIRPSNPSQVPQPSYIIEHPEIVVATLILGLRMDAGKMSLDGDKRVFKLPA